MVDSSKFTPGQIAGAGMGATAGGGILSAFGALSSGIAGGRMYDYQSALARMNAQIYRQDADFAMQAGEAENTKFGLQAGQRLGQQKVALASSGFDITSGSAKQVIASQEMLNRMDMTTIRSNAAKTAYNYQEQASAAEGQAQLYSMAADNTRTAGLINMGSSFLGTAGSVSSEWLKASQLGML